MKKLFKNLTQSEIVMRSGVFILFVFLRFYCSLLRYTWNDTLDKVFSQRLPVIIAFWHQNILVMIFFLFKIPRYRHHVTVLISPSRDGEWAARFLKRLKVRTIRASTYKNPVKGGIQVLRSLRDENNSLALAVDGPRGPRHYVQPGVFTLAAKSKRPVVPLQIAVSRKKHFSSWDRCVFPLPFASVKLMGKGFVTVEESFILKEMQKILIDYMGE